jgi:hypothetical protein
MNPFTQAESIKSDAFVLNLKELLPHLPVVKRYVVHETKEDLETRVATINARVEAGRSKLLRATQDQLNVVSARYYQENPEEFAKVIAKKPKAVKVSGGRKRKQTKPQAVHSSSSQEEEEEEEEVETKKTKGSTTTKPVVSILKKKSVDSGAVHAKGNEVKTSSKSGTSKHASIVLKKDKSLASKTQDKKAKRKHVSSSQEEEDVSESCGETEEEDDSEEEEDEEEEEREMPPPKKKAKVVLMREHVTSTPAAKAKATTSNSKATKSKVGGCCSPSSLQFF